MDLNFLKLNCNTAEDFVTTLPPGDPDWQTFEEAVRQDPVALSHNIVHVIWNTGQQHEAFDDLVRDGEQEGVVCTKGSSCVH